MKKLQERKIDDVIEHHCARPGMEVSFDTGEHRPRVELSRRVLANAIASLSIGSKPLRIYEFGCAGGDISGPFAQANWVRPSQPLNGDQVDGWDCRSEAIEGAREKYPNGTWHLGMIEHPGFGLAVSQKCDVVVLCEVLEHLVDPEAFVQRWLPRSLSAVISHPIEGDIGVAGDLSGGDHIWSFSEADHLRWFALGGHKAVESVPLTIGGYNFLVSRSVRE